MKNILIVGATSAIAEAVARQFAARGAVLFLAARDHQRLLAVAADLRLRGAARIECSAFDARDLESIPSLLDNARSHLGSIDVALIAHGTLSQQSDCEQSPRLIAEEMAVNAVSVMELAMRLAQMLERQQHGVIAVISSVAGDRGRKSNYVYGAAKAAVSTFLSGLRQRLHRSGVAVVTIKPGFVDTPMTAAFPKGALWAQPSMVARDIVCAMERGTPVLYTPWFWRPILWLVRAVPERLFMRL